MKKLFKFAVMTLALGFMTSCGSKSKTTEITTTDSVVVDTIAEDSIVVDSVVTDSNEVARGETEGFGRCLVSGCYCKEFEGRGQTCRNCGHAYKKHY